MVDRRPDHCPTCGTPTSVVEEPSVFHCPVCERYVFHNPAPNARVVVLDHEGGTDRALLVEVMDEHRVGDQPDPPESEWMTPGGHVEVGEDPARAAARELREETGLVADPAALTLFDAVTRQVAPGAHGLILLYAVARSTTNGTVEAGSDAGDARFWSPAELAASDRRYRDLHDEPERHRTFPSLVDLAREALDGR